MLNLPGMMIGFLTLRSLAYKQFVFIWHTSFPILCFLIFLSLGGGATVFAQNFDQYQLLKSSGPIPARFLSPYPNTSPSVPLEARTHTLEKDLFLETSSFYTYHLLQSGKVLFRDLISQYLSEIADSLLKDHPDIRKGIQIYSVRSSSPNAFSSNDGIILVNLGLLTQLESEAELAFILCHEISHILQQHSLEIFQNTSSLLAKSQSTLKSSSLQQRLEQFHEYSRQKEYEADSLGLVLFLNSSYDLQAPIHALQHLFSVAQRAPKQDLTFSPQLLEVNHLLFPQRVWLPDSLAHLYPVPEHPKQLSHTHPAPQQRILKLQQLLKGVPNVDKTFWKVGRLRFEKMKKISLFEICHLLLLNREYESAIYQALVLQAQHPNSFFLKKIIGQSLYGLAKYVNAGRFWDVHQDFEEVMPQRRGLHYLIENLLPEELNMAALAYLWQLHTEYQDDQEIQLMSNDLIDELEWEETMSEASWIQDQAFWQMVRTQQDSAQLDVPTSSAPHLTEKQKMISGKKLGLAKVVFVDPMYLSMDYRKTQPIIFAESEKKKKQFSDLLHLHATSVQLDAELLSPPLLNNPHVDKFNHIALLNDWMEEKMASYDLDLVSINHTEVQRLQELYGTSYFVWTEIISTAQKRNGKLLLGTAGVLFPPILPYTLYYLFSPKYETIAFAMIFDIQSGNPIWKLSRQIQMKDRPDLLHSLAYDLVFQIQQPKE